MPNSTRSNKETQLLFSPDPASLERSIRKEARSSTIDNTTYSSVDFWQPPSTQTLVLSTDSRSPLSTKDTHLPLTNIFHPTSIDTSVRTSIDTEPWDMVATLILVRDDRGNLYDQEGHLHNAEVKKPQKTSRRINNPGIIGACHCGAEYETEYSVLIKTHTATSIDSAQPKSTDAEAEKSVNICQGEWENDYYIPSMATHTMHTEEYDEDYEEERD
uniref:Uncharacterized protein n=1 Tax=Brassica campestris TaxID=3711 RepID=M4FD10_BRACM